MKDIKTALTTYSLIIMVLVIVLVLVITTTSILPQLPYNQENLKACQQLKGKVVIRLSVDTEIESYMTCDLKE